MAALLAKSVRRRFAVGFNAGSVSCVWEIKATSDSLHALESPRCAMVSGFSVHANVCDDRTRQETRRDVVLHFAIRVTYGKGREFGGSPMATHYQFLTQTYETERLKTLSVWSMFEDTDLEFRPNPTDPRGRSVREHMVHQCMSENLWFVNMFGFDVSSSPLPDRETRLEFLRIFADHSGKRAAALRTKDDGWWEDAISFFGEPRPRTWIMVRRIAHSAHHRGQQTALLRMLGRNLYSTYGPTADTGGLPANQAVTVYPYPNVEEILQGESAGGRKAHLPGSHEKQVTERP